MSIDSKVANIDIQSIRNQFPILKRSMRGKPLVFLDSAASSQKPQVVLDTVNHYNKLQHANVHRGVYELSQEATDAFELARTRVGHFINANSVNEIIFTKGTTESINLVASSFGKKFLNHGDEILISAMEHHSNIVPWQMICEERGASLKIAPLNELGELDFEAFKNLLSPKTKLIAISHVSNTLGTINPIKDIVAAAKRFDIPVLVDGAQATLHQTIDVQDLDVDFYAFSGHKVYGPTGIGVLYGKSSWLEKLPPYQGGGEMIKEVTFEKTTYNVIPFKFEAGTPNISGAIGLGVALEFIKAIGQENIQSYEADLLAYATEKLKSIEGLTIIGNAKNKASVISFLIDGTHPFDIGSLLDKMGIAVRTGHHCTQPLMNLLGIPGTVRASFAVYTSREDIDALVNAVVRAKTMLLS